MSRRRLPRPDRRPGVRSGGGTRARGGTSLARPRATPRLTHAAPPDLHARCRLAGRPAEPSKPTVHMRSDTLHAALRAFAEEAAGLLSAETAEGAEIPFELVEEGRRGARTPLYCYRPLVGEFLRTRGSALERLPSHPPAAGVLADHADRLSRYLSAVGERPSGGPPAALQAFLGAVFAEQTDFAVDD